ncbi:MAG: efflux RND transporter periplasmic adaptor subunit [Bacteroidota bacterium]
MNHKLLKLSSCLLVVAALFSSCSKKGDPDAGKKVQSVPVRIKVLQPMPLVDGILVAGTVKAYEDAMLSPEEGGVVKEWKVKKGQRVRRGELIVALKDDVIKASYEAAEAQNRMAELNLDKQGKVFDEQGISELQFKNFQFSRDAAKANADLMKARWERTQLRSPIDGIVDNTIPNEGEFAPPGVPLARVVNTSVIKIQAEVPELYSGSIVTGTAALITFDAVPGDTLKGTVAFVAPTVSAANRTMQIELVLPNPLRKLKPEMVAKVKLLRKTKTNALMVSEEVVQLVDRDRSILYVENGGKAEERILKLGGRQGNTVEILEGVRAGDRVIVTGYQKLTNGSPVTIMSEGAKP